MDILLSISMTDSINVANVLYLMSYFVRDIIALRILTMAGAVLVSLYFYSQPMPMMTPVYWNIVFILINMGWTLRLLRQRRSARHATARDANYASVLLLDAGRVEEPCIQSKLEVDRVEVIDVGSADGDACCAGGLLGTV